MPLEAVDHDPFDTGPSVTAEGRPRIIISTAPKSKLEPVDHDPFATDYGGMAADIAKSAGIGVAKGAIGIAGLPGDLTNLGAKGIKAASDIISNAIGADKYVPPEGGSALNNIPTSESLTKAIEDKTGKFYEPQTTPGHYAETVGEFAPAALAGPGGIARKLALQAVVPGVASEAAGQATQGTSIEPYARAVGGIAGGLGAHLATQPSQAAKTISQQFAEAGVTPQIVDEARKLMNSGIKLSWPEALSKAAGRPILTDKLRILESDPVTSGRMADFFADRPQQVDAAGMDAVSQLAPPTSNPFEIGPQVGKAADETIGGVRQTINKAAEPYYQAAEGVTLTPAEMSQVRAIPNWTEARDAVRNGPDAWRVAHLPDNSVGFLNEVKKHFDQLGENSASKFNPARNKQTQNTYEKGASAVRQIGIAKSPEYEIALEIQKQARDKFLQPLLEGPMGDLAKKDVTTRKAIAALFPSNPLENSHNVIYDTISELAKKRPVAAAQLVRTHVANVFNNATRSLTGGPAQWGGAKFAAILTGDPQQRENLKAAITALHGKQGWEGFEGFLNAVEAIGMRQAKGSLTAFNPDQLKSLSGSDFIGSTVRLGASPGKWWKFVDEAWGNWNKGKNMNALADILLDPKSAPVLKRIATMPTGSRQAGYLASRLILQSENALMQPREARRQ